MRVYENILKSIEKEEKLLSVLIDPDKVAIQDVELMSARINASDASHIFVGGSTVAPFKTEIVVEKIKEFTTLPVVIFPGDVDQISDKADALLFLNLISGRNPDYLIEKQIQAASRLRKIRLEVIPTSYILTGEINDSAVHRVTKTFPISVDNLDLIVDTAFAGQLLGHKLVYLEAGSGASQHIHFNLITEVKKAISIPLIVGGGIKTKSTIKEMFSAGADMVVIGTAFENDFEFFNKQSENNKSLSKI